jgi:hypothetical protein
VKLQAICTNRTRDCHWLTRDLTSAPGQSRRFAPIVALPLESPRGDRIFTIGHGGDWRNAGASAAVDICAQA